MLFLAWAQPAFAEQYIYKSYVPDPNAEVLAGFKVEEVVLDTDGEKIFWEGKKVGTYRTFISQDNTAECLSSVIWEFCLPPEFDGTQKTWKFGSTIYVNMGKRPAGYLDNTEYFVINGLKEYDRSRSSQFYYSTELGLLGVQAGTNWETQTTVVFWLTGRNDGFKF